MKLLFDQNISYKIVGRLSGIFPECSQVRSLGFENATDREIWNYAKEEGYTIVTFDSDFYDFSIVWGHPPKIIWLRTMNQTTFAIQEILIENKEQIFAFEENNELECLEINKNVR